MNPTSRDRVELVARIYATNQEASQALGIAMRSFSRLCRRYGIESPHTRQECRRRAAHRTTEPTED